jgi:hypothetical protein
LWDTRNTNVATISTSVVWTYTKHKCS